MDTYLFLPVLVTKSYLTPGISLPVPLMLVYCAGIVESSPEDFSPAIDERFEK